MCKGTGIFRRVLQEQKCWQMLLLFYSTRLHRRTLGEARADPLASISPASCAPPKHSPENAAIQNTAPASPPPGGTPSRYWRHSKVTPALRSGEITHTLAHLQFQWLRPVAGCAGSKLCPLMLLQLLQGGE